MLKRFSFSLAMLAAVSANALADPVYDTAAALSGTRTQADFVEGGNYAGDSLSVAWNITSLGSAGWRYNYTFTGFQMPGASHVVLDLSDNSLTDPNVMTDIAASYDYSLEFGTFTGSQPSNPGLAGPITGVKVNTENPGSTFSFAFTSNRAPVWGDFYLKGGNDSFAYNNGLTLHATSMDVNDFIARPDTLSAVPEPSSVVLVGLGALGLAGLRLRRRIFGR